MAQWKYQFSGHTHATKVLCIEYSLRLAVASLSVCSEVERAKKSEAVLNLSERLLAARLKKVKAKMSQIIPRSIESQARLQKRYDQLGVQAELIAKGGIQHILEEFGVSVDWLEDNRRGEAPD